jgi:hypothetical protein
MWFRFHFGLYNYLRSQRPKIDPPRPAVTLFDMSEDRDPNARPQFVQAFDSGPKGAMRRAVQSSEHRVTTFWRR